MAVESIMLAILCVRRLTAGMLCCRKRHDISELLQNEDMWDLPFDFQAGHISEELAENLLETTKSGTHKQVILQWPSEQSVSLHCYAFYQTTIDIPDCTPGIFSSVVCLQPC